MRLEFNMITINPTEPDIFRQKLNVKQERAIELILAGQSDGKVAKEVGVTRQTICAWRLHNPEFIATLNTRRRELFDGAQDRLRSMLPQALDRLASELDGPQGWRVALRIIDMVGLAAPRDENYGSIGIGLTNADAIVAAEADHARPPSELDQIVSDIFDIPPPLTQADLDASRSRLRQREKGA